MFEVCNIYFFFGMSASSVQFSRGSNLASQGPHFGLENACPCVGDRIRHLWPILSLVAELCKVRAPAR